MSEEARNVTSKQGGALAKIDFVADSGMGLENIEKTDLALPFLKLLQSGSDETKKNMLSMWREPKQACFIIQLQRNCIMVRRGLK